MFIVILIVYLIVAGLTGRFIWQLLPFSTTGLWISMAVYTFLSLSFVLFMLTESRLPFWLAEIGHRITTSWFIVFLYLLLAALVISLIGRFSPATAALFTHNWKGCCLLAVALIGLLTYGNLNYHNKRRVALTIHTDKHLSKPLKIVGISDLHIGYSIQRGEVARWVRRINDEKPDLILIAGDIIDSSLRPIKAKHMLDELRELKAPLGVYACVGNHEYISNLTEGERLIREAGIRLLRDEAVNVSDDLCIIGRDDATNRKRKSLSQLTQGIDKQRFLINLDHQPHHLEEVSRQGIDLQLSGHTHRGQVWPISWVVDRMYEVSHGYLRKGNSHIYVSSGIGIWGGKFRIGTQSEYVVMMVE